MKIFKKQCVLLLFAAVILFCANNSIFSQKLVDTFEYTNAEESMARIDRFLIEMQNDPQATAYFIIYGGKVNKKGEVEAHMKQLPYYLMFRRFDKDQVTIVNGGFRENLSWDFWLVSPGEEFPEPKSTVEFKDVRTKGKFSKKIDYLYNCCE